MTNTGIGDVGLYVFRKPAAIVNSLPLGYINTAMNPTSIWLPKKIIWKNSKKQLTLKEQINTGVIGFSRSEDYEKAGVDLIDNSPDEITKTVLELEAKITGTWESQTLDKELQERFWKILKTWEIFPKYHGKSQSKLSDIFLRENHVWFLD